MDDEVARQLDNPSWFALTGAQSAFSEGAGRARRYRPDVSVFAATVDDSADAWTDLADVVGPGGEVVLNRAGTIVVPSGWATLGAGSGFQMVLDGEPSVDPSAQIRTLTEDDVDNMTALVALTEPGPFRPRTFDLGGYVGIVDDGRLLAMAGRRVAIDTHVEISAVCTDPAYRGQGLGTRLVRAVAAAITADGDRVFLHAAAGNTNAIRLYESIGFRLRRVTDFLSVTVPAT